MSDDKDTTTTATATPVNVTAQLAEVTAMQDLVKALGKLEPDSVGRVLRWAADTFKVAVNTGSGRGHAAGTAVVTGVGESMNGNGTNGAVQFTDLAELYAATNPDAEADKVLVTCYWFQYGEGKTEIGSQEINSALKNLGHPIKNITSAFDTLKARKPAPVIQLKKSGASKQARKTFKVTVAGKTAVEAMISPQQQ